MALTLRLLGGLTDGGDRARLPRRGDRRWPSASRARKPRSGRRSIPFRSPPARFPERVSGVLAVLYLVFNEGYLATGPDTDPVRRDLTDEAIRLGRLIVRLCPMMAEVAGLLALMLLTDARRTARVRRAASWSPSMSRTGRAGTRR